MADGRLGIVNLWTASHNTDCQLFRTREISRPRPVAARRRNQIHHFSNLLFYSSEELMDQFPASFRPLIRASNLRPVSIMNTIILSVCKDPNKRRRRQRGGGGKTAAVHGKVLLGDKTLFETNLSPEYEC